MTPKPINLISIHSSMAIMLRPPKLFDPLPYPPRRLHHLPSPLTFPFSPLNTSHNFFSNPLQSNTKHHIPWHKQLIDTSVITRSEGAPYHSRSVSHWASCSGVTQCLRRRRSGALELVRRESHRPIFAVGTGLEGGGDVQYQINGLNPIVRAGEEEGVVRGGVVRGREK